ncbi:MAG: IPT/TIG domain-containing protein [Cyanobacteria bacterium HKST-UBA01]|nr:IPT/TIG domain-containing protein [Cyanobacteria bacterium HKST-UBA01]
MNLSSTVPALNMGGIKTLLSVISFSIVMLSTFNCGPSYAVAEKTLAEGGPYQSQGTAKIQKFTAEINISADQAAGPLWITFYNGYSNRPGYNWVRVFLASPQAESVSGDILVDEHTFVRSRAVTKDVTGRIPASGRKLIIEGEGERGAIFSWILTTPKSSVSVLNVTNISAGKTFLLHGTGFSGNEEENEVTVNGTKCEVIGATTNMLTVKAPEKLDAKKVSVSVKVNGQGSNSLMVNIATPPPVLISCSPYGGPVGGVLNIRGSNFSRIANENVVRIGDLICPVIKVMDTGTLLVRIPNWGSEGAGSMTIPLTITVNGVPSKNHLSFWCVSHYYGGDPNAAIYHYD